MLGFALEDFGSQLTLAQLVREAPQELAHALNIIKQDLSKLAVKIITDGKADGIYLSTKNIQNPPVTADEYHTLITPIKQQNIDFSVFIHCRIDSRVITASVYQRGSRCCTNIKSKRSRKCCKK